MSLAYKGIQSETITLPSFVNKVVDSTGTGDALLSYATLSLVATKSLTIASILGSFAAACECESDGNVDIKIEQIIKKINSVEKTSSYKVYK